ncbi:MAG: hypothetical protein DRP66_06855 [Planctomycetota bacterium]|nr:MAG: hypothetical protein DRP66_06855 [Planctomycetota bacterium]
MPAHKEDKTTQTADRADYLRSVADELVAVRRRISAQLITGDDSIDAMLRQIGLRNGKMLRPALVLLVAKSCGNTTETHIRIAAIVELLHAATLLHDDVLDEAQSRRRASTANCLWGNESAVLLGDFLLGKVFVMCSRLERRDIARVLSDTAVDICRGELSQNIQRRNFDLTQSRYCEIIKDKTAALFSACCYVSSLAAGDEEHRNLRLREFGLKVGMAFQITDDLLDIVGDEASVGKTLGTDLATKKITLPVIHMLSTVDDGRRLSLIKKLTGKLERTELREMLEQSGSLDYTRAAAQRYCAEAVALLETMEGFSDKDGLPAIARSIAARHF